MHDIDRLSFLAGQAGYDSVSLEGSGVRVNHKERGFRVLNCTQENAVRKAIAVLEREIKDRNNIRGTGFTKGSTVDKREAAKEPVNDFWEQQVSQVFAVIRAEMGRKDWKQKDLAEAMSTSQTIVSNLMSGSRPMRLDHLLQVAKALDVKPAVLLAPILGDE